MPGCAPRYPQSTEVKMNRSHAPTRIHDLESPGGSLTSQTSAANCLCSPLQPFPPPYLVLRNPGHAVVCLEAWFSRRPQGQLSFKGQLNILSGSNPGTPYIKLPPLFSCGLCHVHVLLYSTLICSYCLNLFSAPPPPTTLQVGSCLLSL